MRGTRVAEGFDFDAPLFQEEPVIPDSIEPVLGYKALNVGEDNILYSPSYCVGWPMGKRIEAQCSTQFSHWTWVPVEGEPREMDATETLAHYGGARWVTAVSSATFPGQYKQPPKPNNPLPPGWSWSWEPLTHAVPEETCHCGIYIADNPERCLQYLGPDGVIVEVALWGKVIPAHSGARGQYAYPQKLLVPRQMAEEFEATAMLYGVPIDVLDAADPVPQPSPVIQPQLGQINTPALESRTPSIRTLFRVLGGK
jgi:hypothetical protein